MTFRTTDTAPSSAEDEESYIRKKIEQIRKKDLPERYHLNDLAKPCSPSSFDKTSPNLPQCSWSKSSGPNSTQTSSRTSSSLNYAVLTIAGWSTARTTCEAMSKKSRITSSSMTEYGNLSSKCTEEDPLLSKTCSSRLSH